MIRHYYQLEFTQRSPLRIGAGFGDDTDSDVIQDRRGMPFLPGSSLAGLLRSEFEPKSAEDIFGYVKSNGMTRESRILISDATLSGDAEVRIATRDGVGLNERKTAIPGAKYDFQTAEANKPYRAVLELTDNDYAPALKTVLERWIALGVSVGARTTRGYGRMEVSVRDRSFSLPDDLKNWLAFEPFDAGSFADCLPWERTDVQETGIEILRASLQIKGTFSVRANTSSLVKRKKTDKLNNNQSKDNSEATADDDLCFVTPDTVPMENRSGNPVIPGTSWAGAFLHHMRALADSLDLGEETKQEIDRLFGVDPEAKRRSAIRFSETEIVGSERMLVTRTAIERFTAAPRNRALFTSEVAVGGTGELTVTIPSDTPERVKGLLGAALCDVHLGLLGFGGENGIGRGMAEITRLTVNGTDRTEAFVAGKISALWKEDSE